MGPIPLQTSTMGNLPVGRALGALVCVKQCLSRGMLYDRRDSVKMGEFARRSMGKYLMATLRKH